MEIMNKLDKIIFQNKNIDIHKTEQLKPGF